MERLREPPPTQCSAALVTVWFFGPRGLPSPPPPRFVGPGRGPPSPLLLPDLGHVQVQTLQALQHLDVLCVERHIHDHQPANHRQRVTPHHSDCVCVFVCVWVPVLGSSIVDDAESSQLSLQVHLKTAVNPQEQHL